LQCLQFSSFLFKALLYLHQAYLILLVLLVLQLNLVEHLVYTSNFLSEPVVLFAHVILQIDQFRSGHHIFLLVIKLLGKFSSRIMAGLPRVFDQNTVIQISLHALNLLRGRFCGLILWLYMVVVLLYNVNTYFLTWIVSLNPRKTAISDALYFLQMFIKLATFAWLIVIIRWWGVMLILKDLVWQVNGYEGINVCIVVYLRVILVTIDHHALFCVLDQMSVITTFFTKLLSTDTDQAFADWSVSRIF